MKTSVPPVLISFSLVCFALIQNTQALNLPPDGGYPDGNTAEGQAALFSLTTSVANTAVGWLSLNTLDSGKFNTAIGAGTLIGNTANQNTATGAGALFNTLSAATIRPMEHLRFLTTYKVATTRPSVLVHSLTTLRAATMLHWAAAPAPVRQPVQITSMLAQGCRVWLAKATPVTSRASLARLLPPESRSSLTQTTSWEPPCPQSALRKRSDRWTKRATHSWR